MLDLAPADLDVLVAMSQPALDKYIENLKNEGTLIYDSKLVDPGTDHKKTLGLEATEIAHKKFGRDVVANVIMLGCLVGFTGAVSGKSLRKVISASVPLKTVALNLEAFDVGFEHGSGKKRV